MLLERDNLLAALADRLAAAAGGDGSVVFVGGEAGIGKTSLVREFARRVGPAALVLAGACDPLATPRPLSPVLDIAADPDSGIGDIVAEGGAPYDIFAELLARLRGTIRPTLMVVEDVHWADAATLDFLRYVGRRADGTNAVVLATYRDDEVGPDHPLRTVLGDLAGRAHRLSLEPLSRAAVAELAGGRDVDVDGLVRVTGGNPFYVTEVLAGGETIPRSVADAVMARVARLDTEARRVVEVTAAAPRSLEARHAARMADAPLAAAERAVHAGVLVGDGPHLRFRHELARAAVESSMLDARRIALHRRMIDVLEAEERRDPARLAHHAARAGDAGLVLRYAPLAADEAIARGAHREAAGFLATAVDHATAGDERADLQQRLSWELVIIDRPEEGAPHSAAALAHYRAGGDRRRLGRALLAHARPTWFGDSAEANRLIAEAVAVLEHEPPGEDLVRALHLSAQRHMLSRRLEASIRDAKRCLEISTALGFDQHAVVARIMAGTAELVAGDPDRGIEIVLETMAQPEAVADYRNRLIALGMLGTGGGEVRRYQDALRWLAEEIELGQRYDEDYTVGYARAWVARIHFEQGRWDEAATAAAQLAAGRASINRITALGALGRVRVRRGDPGAAEALAEALDLARSGELQYRWPIVAGLAELAWLRGDLDGARQAVAADYAEALEQDSRWARGELGFWMWRAGAIDAPPARAAEPFALQMAGSWRDAAAAWRELGCPYDEAMALADSADEEALRRALAILHGLGGRPAADLVRAKLRDLGVDHVPARPRAGASGALTPRQAEVLGLVCQGLTDAEIATRLYISTKTAGHHVSAILRKLGVRSRTEAAAQALRMGIVAAAE